MSVRGNVHLVFVVEMSIFKFPIQKSGSGEQQYAFLEALDSTDDKGVGW